MFSSPRLREGSAMARVRMRRTISGTTGGRPWPERGGEIDVRDEEAARLVRQRMADRVEQSAEQKQSEPEPTVERPTQADRKQAWVDYAVSLGETDAAEYTKAELVELYGGE